MEYKQLGKTTTKIPAIGQGAMGIGGYFTEDRSNDVQCVKMLRLGIAFGMTLIDTAEAYGAGHSEELVGRAIRDCRKEVFVATKVSPEHLAYNDVLRACEGSLRRLKTDYIDLYQVHWPNPAVPIEETLGAMVKLVKDGEVRHIGVSNFSLRQLKRANEVCKIDAVQVEYNLFDRTAEADIIPYCEQEGITVLAYSPLEQGRRCNAQGILLRMIAKKYGKSVAQIVLRWLTLNQQVVAIPKAVTPKHIGENAVSTDFDFDRGDAELISQTFECQVVNIPTDRIRVNKNGLGDFAPSVETLATDILAGESIKPIKVIKANGGYDYILTEGKLRYWAWVTAHDGKVPILALVREEVRK